MMMRWPSWYWAGVLTRYPGIEEIGVHCEAVTAFAPEADVTGVEVWAATMPPQ